MFAQWLFTYLVEERGFSLLESGFLYVLPFATGAAMAARRRLRLRSPVPAVWRALGLPFAGDGGARRSSPCSCWRASMRPIPTWRSPCCRSVSDSAVHRGPIRIGLDLRRRSARVHRLRRREHRRQCRGIPGAGRRADGRPGSAGCRRWRAVRYLR